MVVAVKSMSPVLSPVRRKSAIIVLSLTAVLFVAMLLSASYASAGPGPKSVRGYINDYLGNIGVGADVLVEVVTPGDVVRASGTFTSDSTGFYSVLFGNFDWDVGDTFRVTSTFQSSTEVNSSIANANPIQWVNITYPYEIPQFGGWVGFAAAGGILAVVALVFVGNRKKKSAE
jgi:hypothetical protein